MKWQWQRRCRFVTAVLVAASAAVIGLAPPAASADLPIVSEVTAQPFMAGRFRVTVEAGRDAYGDHSFCIEAEAQKRPRPDILTIEEETSCFEKSEATYRYAPFKSKAAVRGRVNTIWRTSSFLDTSDGASRRISASERRSTATVDLRWTGHGRRRVDHDIQGPPPLMCYSLLPICSDVTASLTRDAFVRGSIVFHGIGVVASVPAHHRGAMTP